MKDFEDGSKKQLILQTTLELIQEVGLEGLTIRKISSRARINVALIHYYFGSKENLIHEAICYVLQSAEKLRLVLKDAGLTGEERLRRVFRLYMDILERYPSLVFRIFQADYKRYSEIFNKKVLDKILADLQVITGEDQPAVLFAMFMQTIGALSVSANMTSFFPEQWESPWLDKDALLDLFFQRYFSNHETMHMD